MLLVPREVLFDVASKKQQISLSESDSSAFESFCHEANTQFYNAISKSNNDSKAMALFSDAMLDFLKSHVDSIRYINQGSSRIVFAMSDNTALKLAKSYAGIAQNKQEAKICMDPDLKYAIFPDFYGADKKNYLALNCELCSHAKQEDFKELFGCQTNVIVNVIQLIIQMKLEDWEFPKLKMQYLNMDVPTYAAFVQRLMDDNSLAVQAIKSLIEFYRKNGLDELLLGDIEVIDNWGITFRDDQKVAVIIDAGFNTAINKEFYLSKLDKHHPKF